jgi:hypothetical protein
VIASIENEQCFSVLISLYSILFLYQFSLNNYGKRREYNIVSNYIICARGGYALNFTFKYHYPTI